MRHAPDLPDRHWRMRRERRDGQRVWIIEATDDGETVRTREVPNRALAFTVLSRWDNEYRDWVTNRNTLRAKETTWPTTPQSKTTDLSDSDATPPKTG